MPKISIIVPVYNVENYIGQCLKSISAQTFTDIEMICIDDGSTDHSGKLLDSFAVTDHRVKVIHKENAGYGVAMNVGLSQATGEYIGIVESDDKIAENMYELLYKAAHEHDLDFVKSEAFYWFDSIHYIKRVHEKSLDGYYDQVLGEKERNLFFAFFMNIWTGIYKRSFLTENHIRFQETPGASYQDNGFWMQTCLYAKRVMWLNQAFYFYRQDNPEASVKSTTKMLAMTKEYEYLEKLIIARQQYNLLPYCYSMRLFRLRGTFYRIADDQKISFLKQVSHDYDSYKANIRFNKYLDNWIRSFLKEPQEFCNRTISEKSKIRKAIENSDGVIIYGAGNQGDRVLRLIYNEGLYDYISCFAVSSQKDTGIMADKKIILIEEAAKEYPNATVIVATVKGTKAYQSMHEKLKDIGIEKMMDSSDIEQYFYIL